MKNRFMLLKLILVFALLVLGFSAETRAAVPDYLFADEWGTSGSGNGQFSGPSGAAVDTSGNVYVADERNDRIQKFSSTGVFLGTWGTKGAGNGQFNGPRGVAVDASGNIYVTDFHNNRVQKFDNNFAWLMTFGAAGTADGEFTGPFNIAVNAAGTIIYVTDSINDRVQKFDGSGVFVSKWSGNNGPDGAFFQPEGVALDIAGNVYVADSFNDRIQKFDGNGGFIAEWGAQGDSNGQFFVPRGIAVDGAGNIFVTDSGNVRVQKFDSTFNFLTQWGAFGSDPGSFLAPEGLAVNAVTGSVYVVDSQNNRVQVFSTAIPAAPSNLTAAEVDPVTPHVNLSWNDNSDNETGFRIERASNNGQFLPLNTVGPGAGSYVDTAIAAFTVYSYRVLAFNATGDSIFSNTATTQLAPVRIGSQNYPALTDAFANSAQGDTVEAWGVQFNEPNLNINIGSAGFVTFIGGYDTLYSASAGMTDLQGSLTISGAGALVLDKLTIK
ncbi:MAG: SMP-30/gluconolactonase/LRE family protein [Nitrospirae bacterium]|nr:SMP-30/gluconolactonase/LRE family protein [Nitrospirota bacterium]